MPVGLDRIDELLFVANMHRNCIYQNAKKNFPDHKLIQTVYLRRKINQFDKLELKCCLNIYDRNSGHFSRRRERDAEGVEGGKYGEGASLSPSD